MLNKFQKFSPPLLTIIIVAIVIFTWPSKKPIFNIPPIELASLLDNKEPTRNSKDQGLSPNETDLTTIINRPLFSKNRRNPEPIAIVRTEKAVIEEIVKIEQPIPIKTPDLEFVGVMKMGENLSALLRVDQSEKWYQLGSTLSGWEIITISDNAVTLINGTQEITIAITR